jgi:hypothetical protein
VPSCGAASADPDQILLRVLGAVLDAARLDDRLADGRVLVGGELVDAVRVERGGDQLRALEGEFEEFALGGVDGVAEGEGRAGGGPGGGLLRPGRAPRGRGGALAAAVAGPAGQLGDALDDELGVEDAEHAGELHGDLVLGAAVLDAGHDGRRLVEGRRAPGRGLQVVAGDDLAERELEERGAGFGQFGDRLVALRQAQLAGVHAVRRDRDVGLGGELLVVLEGAQGRFLAGRVAVEGEDHASRAVVHQEPAEDLDVVAAEGRAAGRDGRGHAGEVAGHDVRVALDHDGPAGLGDVLLGEVDAVQDLGLAVDRGVGGVQVLGSVVRLVELAGAEADHVSADVADGPHQAAPEAVDGAAAAFLGEAGQEQFPVGEALAAQMAGEVVPALKAVADAEVDGGALVEAALGEEDPARVGLGAGGQLLRVPLGGDLVRLDQTDPLAALVGGVVPALLVAQGDAGLGGQALDRLREREVVDLHHERDGVAALLAAEAVEESLARADLEGR